MDGSFDAWAALEPCGQGAKPSAKQPAALWRGIAGIGGRDPSRDPSDGADLGNGAAGKSRYNNSGIKLSISAAKPRPEGLDVAAEIQLLRLADHNHP
jgi:hypothetical protein